MKKLLGAAGMLALLLACGRESAATQQIRSAAAVDLGCDESQIELVNDKPMMKRATGCGRTLTYMYKCTATSGRDECRWTPVRDPSNKLY